MFIDDHTHISFLPRDRQSEIAGTFLTPEELLTMYDEVGIERGVMLPLVSPEGGDVVQSCYEIIEAAGHHPDRLVPFCNVDPRQGDNDPARNLSPIISHYKELGCKGIGEITANLPFDDARVENLFDHAEECEMPVLFHVAARDGCTYGLIDDLGLPRFEGQIKKHPNLVFLCHSQAFWSHISADVDDDSWSGYPPGPVVDGGRIPQLLRTYPNVYGDLSAGSGCNAIRRDPEFGYAFLTEFQDRLLFGTDVNQTSHRHNVLINLKDHLEKARAEEKISQAVFDKITHHNAERILGL